MAPNDTPMTPVKGTAPLAWIVVLTILALGLLPLVISAFSQDNTTTSVNGDKAVQSQYFADE